MKKEPPQIKPGLTYAESVMSFGILVTGIMLVAACTTYRNSDPAKYGYPYYKDDPLLDYYDTKLHPKNSNIGVCRDTNGPIDWRTYEPSK